MMQIMYFLYIKERDDYGLKVTIDRKKGIWFA